MSLRHWIGRCAATGVAAIVFASPCALAAPGQLDPAFGTAGIVRSKPDVMEALEAAVANDVIRQPDGKIVIAGTSGGGQVLPPNGALLFRFNADGTPDKTFGNEGRVTSGIAEGEGTAVLIDGAGRLILVGTGMFSRRGFLVERYLPDGTLDTSFGFAGLVAFDGFGSNATFAVGAALDSAGRIVVLGTTQFLTISNLAVTRYLPSGELDTTFGGTGAVVVTLGNSGVSYGRAVAIDASDRIVVTGNADIKDIGVARLNVNGTFDTSFGTAGRVIVPGADSGKRDHIQAIAIDAAGNIALAGTSADSTVADVVLYRLTPGGALDATFGTGGRALGGLNIYKASSLFLDAAGRWVVGGHQDISLGFEQRAMVARFLPSGAVDTTFGNAGLRLIDFAPLRSVAKAVAPDGGDGVLWAGFVGSEMALGRLLADGASDTSLAGTGTATAPGRLTATSSQDTRWNAVARQADGKLVTGGYAKGSGANRFAVNRFLATGQPDSAFGASGSAQVAFGSFGSEARGIAIDADGRLLAAGVLDDGGTLRRFALARFQPGGALDASFGIGGMVQTTVGTSRDEAHAVVLDASGRILVAGSTLGATRSAFAVVRYLANGSLDPAFGSGGVAKLDIGTGDAAARAIAIDGDGRIVLAGEAKDGARDVVALARLTATGTPDPAFGAAGIATADANPDGGRARALAIDGTGRLVVGGSVGSGSASRFAIMRFSVAGIADATFGTAGVVSPAAIGADSEARAIAIDADGRPVAAGYRKGRYVLARVAANGATDFAAGGFALESDLAAATLLEGVNSPPVAGEYPGSANAFLLQPDGLAVVAGKASPDSAGAILVRFLMASPPGTTPLYVTVNRGNSWDRITSSPAGIDCGDIAFACAADFPAGSTVTLAPTTDSSASFKNWSGDCSGYAPCTVTLDAMKSVTANFAAPGEIVRVGRLVNISTRARVLTDDDRMIAGFIVPGPSAKTVVVRARGPSLVPAGVVDALANPTLELFSGQTVLASNDDWGGAANQAAISSSGLAPADAKESAILTTLAPGPYTAVVSGAGRTTGVGIVEVFETDVPTEQLPNIATRSYVQSNENIMIVGFIIQGDGPRTVVVRARGPSLAAFGVTNPLARTELLLFSGQTQIASNVSWTNSPGSPQVFALGLAPASNQESAIMITLAPGAYTAWVRPYFAEPGVGIIEVFAP